MKPVAACCLLAAIAACQGGNMFAKPAASTLLSQGRSGGALAVPNQPLLLRLDNGLQILLEENHTAPVVALQAWIATGSADDPPTLAGRAHMFEHMLLQGRTTRDVRRISHGVVAAGGEINAWTSHDQTVYHLVLASAFFDVGIDMLADTLMNATFEPSVFERERGVVLDEIKQAQDDPDRLAAQRLFAAAFSGHPYAGPVIGTAESVRALRREDLIGAYPNYAAASKVTLVVVGDFDSVRARLLLGQAFRGMPRGLPRATRTLPPAQTALRVVVTPAEGKESHLLLGFGTPVVNHDDVAALDMLSVLLGQGEGSRLHRELVRNRQSVTSASSYVFGARDPGLFVVDAGLPAGRVDTAVRGMLDEILRLRHEDIGDDELAKARTILESRRAFDKETVRGHARNLGFFATVAGDRQFDEKYLEHLARLTAADLRAVANRYFRVANLTLYAQALGTQPARQAESPEKQADRIRTIVQAAEAHAAVRYAAPAAGPGVNTAQRIVHHVFPSGMKVLVMRDTSVPIMAARATWVGGLRYEDARTSGVSHMLAALLTRGTKTMNAEQILATVDDMAGSLSGFSGHNSFGLQGEFLARHWERGLELMSDCLRNPTFAEEELERQKRLVIGEIRAKSDDLGQVAVQLFHDALWKRHPYRLDPLGTEPSVAELSHRKLLGHYRQHYGVENLTLAIVGAVDPDKVIARLTALFPDGPHTTLETPVVALDSTSDRPQQIFRFRDNEQAHLVLGYQGTTLKDVDRFSLQVLSQVLAGPGGRLLAEIRDKRAIALQISASSMEGIDPGYFAVYAAAAADKLPELMDAIRGELRKVGQVGVSADEVDRAKRYLIGSQAVALQRRSAIATALAFNEAYPHDRASYRQYSDQIANVTPADVLRVARKYLVPEREVLAVVKPPEPTPAAATRGSVVQKIRSATPSSEK